MPSTPAKFDIDTQIQFDSCATLSVQDISHCVMDHGKSVWIYYISIPRAIHGTFWVSEDFLEHIQATGKLPEVFSMPSPDFKYKLNQCLTGINIMSTACIVQRSEIYTANAIELMYFCEHYKVEGTRAQAYWKSETMLCKTYKPLYTSKIKECCAICHEPCKLTMHKVYTDKSLSHVDVPTVLNCCSTCAKEYSKPTQVKKSKPVKKTNRHKVRKLTEITSKLKGMKALADKAKTRGDMVAYHIHNHAVAYLEWVLGNDNAFELEESCQE